VDPGDHRLRKPREQQHQLVARAKKLALPLEVRARAQLLEVVSGAKPFAFGRDDHAAHRRVGGDLFELGTQRRDHCFRQRIETLAAVERQRVHAVLRAAQHKGRAPGSSGGFMLPRECQTALILARPALRFVLDITIARLIMALLATKLTVHSVIH
jgi:hypothetical protein